jgi:hypothetical protein
MLLAYTTSLRIHADKYCKCCLRLGQRIHVIVKKVNSAVTHEAGTYTHTHANGTYYPQVVKMPNSLVEMPNSLVNMPNSLVNMPNSLVEMPNSLVEMPSSLVKMANSLVKTPSGLVKIPNSLVKDTK